MAGVTGGWRTARRATSALLLAVGCVSVYYTYEVLRARADTPQVVAQALSSARLELSPDDLSAAQLDALLAVEDPHFFSHKGWDFGGGTMTTITQSLVKGLYFRQFRPGIRKIRQSLIARFALDPQLSKKDQLRLFINTIWLGSIDGRPIEGFAGGARVFYGKSFADLTFDEYLSLLVFDRPGELNVRASPEGNARRVRQIKRLLAGRCRRPGLLGRAPNCWTEDPI
jgi:membrane carboxypeptidase/penicillin-binding protein